MTQPAIPEPAQSGAYRTPADVAVLRESLRQAHGQWVEVDLRGLGRKSAVLDTLARAASFPPHFGRNWDALADCLQDLPASSSPYVLHLQHAAAARAALGTDWETLLEILGDAAMYWKDRGRTFLAFVDDESADLPVWR